MGKSKGTCGGMRRTCVLGCGKRIVGHPQRLQTLINLHYKKCEYCKTDKHKLNLSDVPFDATANGVADLKSHHSSHTYERVKYNTFNGETGETGEGEVTDTNLYNKDTLNTIIPSAEPIDTLKEIQRKLERKYGDETTYLSKTEKEKLRKKSQKQKKKHKSKFQECLKVIVSGDDWVKLDSPDLTEKTANAVYSNSLPVPLWVYDEYKVKEDIPLMIGSKSYQMKYAWGDCVKSNFHFLWKDWNKTKGNTTKKWIVIVQENTFRHESIDPEEKWIVHHGALDEGDKYYDFSNNRSIVMPFSHYTALGSGRTVATMVLGSYGEVESKMKKMYRETMVADPNSTQEFKDLFWDGKDENWTPYHTYYFVEVLHSQLQIKENPEFYGDTADTVMSREWVNLCESLMKCKFSYGSDGDAWVKDLEETYEERGKQFFYKI